MKIIAVGWNYRGHNAEMNQKETPQNPIIFFKPETALLKDGKPFFLPQFSDRIEYETELVFHISRLGKNIAGKFAHRYYDSVTVGIDLTARDKLAEARANGNPWDIAKGFRQLGSHRTIHSITRTNTQSRQYKFLFVYKRSKSTTRQ